MENNNEKAKIHCDVSDTKSELLFAMLCGSFLLIGFLVEKLAGQNACYALYSYIIAYVFGGFFITIEATKKILKGGFDIDFLMIAAAGGAAYIDSWAEGALLLFLLV